MNRFFSITKAQEIFRFPLLTAKVSAGFPSPAEDYIEGMIDLNQYLIKKPASTFLVRVAGNSMIKAGILANDLLVVDRSIDPTHSRIVIAIVAGELLVRRLYKRHGKCFLLSENEAVPPIEIKGELEIWGVVNHVIRSY